LKAEATRLGNDVLFGALPRIWGYVMRNACYNC
jgi:hypothetical protein